MRNELVLAAVLIPALLSAQEHVRVKGRIVNEKGEAVEYVQIGMPGHRIGTVSTSDGRFEIAVPPDTLDFFHVSYQAAGYLVTGPVDDLVIVLHGQELPPAVTIGGNTKERYLLRPGKRVLGKAGVINCSLEDHAVGREIGSVAHARKPFLVQDIRLSVQSNSIPRCVASINVYRIEGKNESFVNVLHKPIYFDVAVSDAPRDYDIRPEETLLLEPGRYFIAFQLVGYDEKALQAFLTKPLKDRKPWEMNMDFGIYLKSSYLREAALGEMSPFPVNIGISVKGLEYQ